MYVQRVKNEIHVALDDNRGTETKREVVYYKFRASTENKMFHFVIIMLYYALSLCPDAVYKRDEIQNVKVWDLRSKRIRFLVAEVSVKC